MNQMTENDAEGHGVGFDYIQDDLFFSGCFCPDEVPHEVKRRPASGARVHMLLEPAFQAADKVRKSQTF
jgi:hypothetical protein